VRTVAESDYAQKFALVGHCTSDRGQVPGEEQKDTSLAGHLDHLIVVTRAFRHSAAEAKYRH